MFASRKAQILPYFSNLQKNLSVCSTDSMEEELDVSPPTFFQKYGVAVILGGISLFFIVASLILLFKTTQTSEPIVFSDDQSTASARSRMIVVDIEGAVLKPGVYELPEGARVEDLLAKADGLTGEADSEWVAKTLNRAQFLQDGGKLYIPKKGTVQGTSLGSENTNPTPGSMSVSGISVNTASEKELDTLPGIGPVTAQKIIAGRPYQRIEELLDKKIVGQSVFEKIKSLLTL